MNRLALLTLPLALLGGCDELFNNGPRDASIDPCMPPDAGVANVAGQWTLRGHGKREGCSDPALDDDFEFESQPLTVAQTDGGVVFVEGAPAGFELTNGRVQGNCVNFQTTEVLADQPDIVRRWNGLITSNANLSGSFNGDGPNTCAVSGGFTAEIRR